VSYFGESSESNYLGKSNHTRFEHHLRFGSEVFRFPQDEISKPSDSDVSYKMTDTVGDCTASKDYV